MMYLVFPGAICWLLVGVNIFRYLREKDWVPSQDSPIAYLMAVLMWPILLGVAVVWALSLFLKELVERHE